MNSGLQLQHVSLSTPGLSLVENLSLIVAPGEIVTLMGPSGCGKSSLLAWIGGVLTPGISAQGQLELDGLKLDQLPPEKRRLGILFQDDMLFPHLNVLGNLIFAVPRDTAERRKVALDALSEVGLERVASQHVDTLSGGQKARVALVRALLAKPRALLLDEPFSALDQGLRVEIRRFVFDHIRERGLPALLVTHDEADARAAGDRVLRPWGA